MRNLTNLRQVRLLGLLVVAAALVGCDGGGDGSAVASSTNSTPVLSASSPLGMPIGTTQPPSGGSTPVGVVPTPRVAPVTGDPAPTISGSAATNAKVGQTYSFQPRGKDFGGTALTYSVSGAPGWTSFSASTGMLTGKPTAGDVGTVSNIIVQVSDGTSSASLAPFAITVAAAGSSSGIANLSWVAPTRNTDGSVLTDLGGYVIHYGTTSKNYTSTVTVSNPGITSYVLDDLPAGTYYITMTTTATNGAQSVNSAEATVTIS